MPRQGASQQPVLFMLPESPEADANIESIPGNIPELGIPLGPRQHSNPLPATPTASKVQRIKIRSVNSFPIAFGHPSSATPGVPPTPSVDSGGGSLLTQSSEVYTRFQQKFRDEESGPSTSGSSFLHRAAESDSDDEAPPGPAASSPPVNGALPHAASTRPFSPRKSLPNPTPKPPKPTEIAFTEEELDNLTPDQRARLEWQSMLSSVLDGEVFRSEKTRIVVALDKVEADSHMRHDVWLGVRAWLRGRSTREETHRLADRRTRVVPAVLEEINSFQAVYDPDPETGEPAPPVIDQVNDILERYEVACSLYPSYKAMAEDHPDLMAPAVQAKLDALNSWVRIYVVLYRQIASLVKFTGSETLDVRQPIKVKDTGVIGEAADSGETTTLVDRMLKEENIQKTFEKRTLDTLHHIIETTRNVILTHAPIFHALNLPIFTDELVRLISFPPRLICASLQTRLEGANRVKDPNSMVMENLSDDFRLAIGLACTLKKVYIAQMLEDEDGYWKLPECMPPEYDAVLIESVLFYFKLLHWRLRNGLKVIYFKETEVLEFQNELMDEVADAIPGGASIVAEQLCNVTKTLIARVVTYYLEQIRLPTQPHLKPDIPATSRVISAATRLRAPEVAPTKETELEEAIIWLAKVLDSVRLRYRKLHRYAKGLHNTFQNSAEYSLDGIDFSKFVQRLHATGHFLIHTQHYEEEGIYLLASSELRHRPTVIRDMLVKAYKLNRREDNGQHSAHSSVVDVNADADADAEGPLNLNDDVDFEESSYIVIIAPEPDFFWQGGVSVMPMDDLDLSTIFTSRARLIADGPQHRLAMAKTLFTTAMSDPTIMPIVMTPSDAGSPQPGTPMYVDPISPVYLRCVVEAQAHLPVIERELQKILKGTTRLAETIVGSVEEVRRSIRTSPQYRELLQNWFTFASEHGVLAEKHLDPGSEAKYSQMLTKLAISWVAFICDDCDPTDRKTFRWAVSALEFATNRTKGATIFQLAAEDFALLRQKVAACMTLLISHFDILGARSSTEAAKVEEEQRKTSARLFSNERPTSPITETAMENQSLRLKWEDSLQRLQMIDERRVEMEAQRHVIGRVVDEEKLENKGWLDLASSASNISVRWQQGKLIGAGAFGAVYTAVNLDSGGMMAAKEIRFQDMSSISVLLAQVKGELRVLEMLSHPNIVEYYGIEVHRDKVYIFEEYCQGGSIADLLEHGRIEDEAVLSVYAMQMLDGLSYLHSMGIVHRDVKPENVMLDHFGVVKLIDFGASKVIQKGQQRTMARTRRVNDDPTSLGPHSLNGTPMYMSPEVIKNDKRGRHGAMDVWSLGCVILECATGRKPWSSTFDNEWAIMYQIGQGNRIPQLPEPWQLNSLGISFIRECVTLDPTVRPTAQELQNHPWMVQLREELEGQGAAESLAAEEVYQEQNMTDMAERPLSWRGRGAGSYSIPHGISQTVMEEADEHLYEYEQDQGESSGEYEDAVDEA